MRKLLVLTTALSLVATSSAHAWYYPPVVVPPVVAPKPLPPPQPHGGYIGHAGGALSIIGIAAILSGYDIYRRWVPCAGDPWRLGGPGFSTPMPAHGNVKPPAACGKTKKRGAVLRVKG